MKTEPKKPHSIYALEKFMKENSFTRKDLEALIGSRGRVSEVLRGIRPLSVSMMKNLVNVWEMDANLLLKDPNFDREPAAATPRKTESKKSIVWMLD